MALLIMDKNLMDNSQDYAQDMSENSQLGKDTRGGSYPTPAIVMTNKDGGANYANKGGDTATVGKDTRGAAWNGSVNEVNKVTQ